MKKILFLLALVFAFTASQAQKVIQLDPVPICYYPTSIMVRLTGTNTDSTFEIYYELRDSNSTVFESGNRVIPAQYIQQFTSNASPEILQQLLLYYGLHMKLEE